MPGIWKIVAAQSFAEISLQKHVVDFGSWNKVSASGCKLAYAHLKYVTIVKQFPQKYYHFD